MARVTQEDGKQVSGGIGLYALNNADEDLGSDFAQNMVVVFSWVLIVFTLPLSLFFCFKVVQQYEKAIIFRSGRLKSGDINGVFFILPCIESYTKIDTRSSVFHVPAQEVLTKDTVTVAVDAVLYYRVCNAAAAITNVKNAHASTKLLAQTALRKALGQKNLHELLSDRDAISNAMASTLEEATSPWGIKVERVEITDVRLPKQLQRAMAVEGEAAREAKAKVIAAEGEHKASKALKEAADTLSSSVAAIQLRYLQTLTTVAAENNKTIIFPMPVHMISQLRQKWERIIQQNLAKRRKLYLETQHDHQDSFDSV